MKAQLEAVVLQMYKSGIVYSEAVHEFRRTFVATVLRENNGNQLRSARELRMHRNTLRRNISEFKLDVKSLRQTPPRRPPQAERPIPSGKKQRIP